MTTTNKRTALVCEGLAAMLAAVLSPLRWATSMAMACRTWPLRMAALVLFLGVTGQAKDYVDAPRPSIAQQYTVTGLGTLDGASGINASGQVVGSTCDGCVANLWRALLWSEGIITDLGTLPGYGLHSSIAGGINASGQVVGGTYRIECSKLYGCYDLDGRAFLWSDGDMTSLGTLPGDTWSSASGINASGQVVGSSSRFEAYPSHAFLWSDGLMSDLGTLPGDTWSEATVINDSGQVVGISGRPGSLHAFLWSDGVMSDLGTLPGYTNSDAHGINASGQVVGESWSEAGRAFLWSDGVMSDLGTLPGDQNSAAFGINATGQVVGTSGGPFPVYRALLWSDGVMTDLNDLIPPDSGWVLGAAAAINDVGQIVGSGWHNGQQRRTAFLLTPIK